MRNWDATTPPRMIMICLALLLTVSAGCSRPLEQAASALTTKLPLDGLGLDQ